MPTNIEGRERLNETEVQQSTSGDYLFTGLVDQSESEIKWVKLHQMFDR